MAHILYMSPITIVLRRLQMHSHNIVSVLLHGITFISPAQTASSKFIYYNISRYWVFHECLNGGMVKISRVLVIISTPLLHFLEMPLLPGFFSRGGAFTRLHTVIYLWSDHAIFPWFTMMTQVLYTCILLTSSGWPDDDIGYEPR